MGQQYSSFPGLTGESRLRPCESMEPVLRIWIPVCTGNPGFRIKCGITSFFQMQSFEELFD